MKILHVIGAFDKKLGGTYSAILSIMDIENSLGYENEVLSLVSENQEYDDELLNSRVHLLEPSFPYLFNYSKPAHQWLEKNIGNYGLLLIHEVWGAMAIQAALTAQKTGTPYVVWPHGSLDPFDLQKKKWLKKIAGSLIVGGITQKANAVCCTSTLEKQVLKTYNKSNSNVHVLPLPINYEMKGNKARFRKAFNVPADDLTFLFLSRVDYKKGLDLFLYAYKAFIEQTKATNTKLIIAGKGTPEYEAYIKKIIQDLNLSTQVTISGFLTGLSKADAYAGADCFVLPSMNENYGIAVIEALQSSLPVLISDNVYIWKSIIPEGGWVCKHDVDSIHSQIAEVYQAFQKGLLNEKTPAEVGERFKKKNLINNYANFYNQVLQSSVNHTLAQPHAAI